MSWICKECFTGNISMSEVYGRGWNMSGTFERNAIIVNWKKNLTLNARRPWASSALAKTHCSLWFHRALRIHGDLISALYFLQKCFERIDTISSMKNRLVHYIRITVTHKKLLISLWRQLVSDSLAKIIIKEEVPVVQLMNVALFS